MKNLFKVLGGLAVTAFFLYLSFRHVGVSQLLRDMARFQWPYLGPVLLLFFLSFWVRAFRWRCIVKHVTDLHTYDSFEMIMIGFMINNVLPARIGEFARAYLLAKRQDMSRSLSLATVAVERLYDGYTLVLLLALGLLYVPDVQTWLARLTIAAAAFYTVALLLLVLLNRFSGRLASLAERGSRVFGDRTSGRMGELVSSFSRGLDLLRSKGSLARVGLLSLLVWLIFAVSVFGMMKGAGLPLPFSSIFSFLGILTLGLTIPSSPGYVGTIQYFSILALELWGIEKTTALSFSIIYHAITYFPVTLLGLWYLARENLALARLKKDSSV